MTRQVPGTLKRCHDQIVMRLKRQVTLMFQKYIHDQYLRVNWDRV